MPDFVPSQKDCFLCDYWSDGSQCCGLPSDLPYPPYCPSFDGDSCRACSCYDDGGCSMRLYGYGGCSCPSYDPADPLEGGGFDDTCG